MAFPALWLRNWVGLMKCQNRICGNIRLSSFFVYYLIAAWQGRCSSKYNNFHEIRFRMTQKWCTSRAYLLRYSRLECGTFFGTPGTLAFARLQTSTVEHVRSGYVICSGDLIWPDQEYFLSKCAQWMCRQSQKVSARWLQEFNDEIGKPERGLLKPPARNRVNPAFAGVLRHPRLAGGGGALNAPTS